MPLNHAVALLEQATTLLDLDARGRPRQVNLRRAVSSAYYAMFHELCASAAAELVGGAAGRRGIRDFLVRKFEHGRMRSACKEFGNADARHPLVVMQSTLGQAVPDAALSKVCVVFVTLQDHRHWADYDLTRRFRRPQVRKLVEEAGAAMEAWEQVRATEQARLFKLCLLVGTSARN